MDPTEEYQDCAAKCTTPELPEPLSVRTHNRFVDRMVQLVDEAQDEGRLEQLYPLLEQDDSARWLAFQLLDRAEVPREIEERCLNIIRALAESDDLDAANARDWLLRSGF